MKARLAVLPGDGIGPEVMKQTLRVIKATGETFGHTFEIHEGLVGGAAYDHYETHLPDETVALCRGCDAILFGSVGGPIDQAHLPKWNRCEANSILSLRKAFSFHANLRPVQVFSEIAHLSPLKSEIIEKGVDLVVVRELLGDIYFGEHTIYEEGGEKRARDVASYTESQIRAVAKVAFETAMLRRKRLCSVHKANVLATSQLWRDVVREFAADFPEVELTELLVDNCAMQIVLDPAQFDVILTTNMFGDILSDIGAVLPGSLGVTPSASLNHEGFGLYEPSGGSAPDIAGKGIANPIAQILSFAMLLRHSFGLNDEYQAIVTAVRHTLDKGIVTGDLLVKEGVQPASTDEFVDALLGELAR